MEIFNIHLFEFLLIAGLALIIFGPERLPEVGRFLGKQLARFLAWQQQSPELQLMNEVRSELEREIASLRDELVRTRTQLDVSQDMATLRKDVLSMVRLRDDDLAVALPTNGLQAPQASPLTAAPIAPPASIPMPKSKLGATPSPVLAELANTSAPAAADPPMGAGTTPPAPSAPLGSVPAARPQPLPVAQSTAVRNTIDDESFDSLLTDAEPAPLPEEATQTPPPPDEHAVLVQRVAQLSNDLHHLVAALHARGLLAEDWQTVRAKEDEESLAR